MTEFVIDIPERIVFDGSTMKERLDIPVVPAEKITGVLHPGQIPTGIIPGLEGLAEFQDALDSLGNRISALEEADLIPGSEFDSHLEAVGNGGHIPLFGLTNSHIAPGAAIAPNKLALEDLRAALQIPQIVDSPDDIGAQPADSDLQAIAQLLTTSFGRSLLTLASAAELQNLLSIPSAVSIGELTYTVEQSSVSDAPTNNLLGTYAKLTDNNNTTGASTALVASGGPAQWIRADLGQSRNVLSCSVAAGFLNGSGISAAVDNCFIQTSEDAVTWEFVARVTGSTNNDFAGTSQLPTPIAIPINRRARYVRLFNSTSNSRAATSELRIRGF